MRTAHVRDWTPVRFRLQSYHLLTTTSKCDGSRSKLVATNWQHMNSEKIFGVDIVAPLWTWRHHCGHRGITVDIEASLWICGHHCGHGGTTVDMEAPLWTWRRHCGHGGTTVDMAQRRLYDSNPFTAQILVCSLTYLVDYQHSTLVINRCRCSNSFVLTTKDIPVNPMYDSVSFPTALSLVNLPLPCPIYSARYSCLYS
ncbi:hypothetical protein Btru_073229 [Bulinus truncatus]|nr:hypothetical protein Btru_073229 [Bulinus truncatus]